MICNQPRLDCSLLQCVAVCCSEFQGVAGCCNKLQCVRVYINIHIKCCVSHMSSWLIQLWHMSSWRICVEYTLHKYTYKGFFVVICDQPRLFCSVLQCVAVHCSVCCSVLQCVAVCCSVSGHTYIFKHEKRIEVAKCRVNSTQMRHELMCHSWMSHELICDTQIRHCICHKEVAKCRVNSIQMRHELVCHNFMSHDLTHHYLM